MPYLTAVFIPDIQFDTQYDPVQLAFSILMLPPQLFS